MKKIIIVAMAVMLSANAYAAIKCAPNPNGTLCCWDVETEGPWRPITCG